MTKDRDLFRKCYGIMYIIIIFNIFVAVESKSPSNRIKPKPTVYPADPFDPAADAETLQKEIKGSGENAKAIVAVLTKRNLVQRLRIAQTYKTYYGEDLKDELDRKLSGKVNTVLMALMTPLPQYYAEELRRAIMGQSTDKNAIVRILSTLNNSEVESAAKAYEQMYSRTLEHDLRAGTSGSFQRLIVSTLQANRDNDTGVDGAKATADAQALLDAVTDDDKVTQFNKILVSRSYQQLRAIFAEYKRISNHDIEEKIEKDICDPVKMGFLSIVKCVKSKVGFFAETLFVARNEILPDHSTLIRIIVTRSEIDLGDIKEAFVDEYGHTPESHIIEGTSGSYQKALLSLLGN